MPAPSGYREEHVSELPSLGGLYARAGVRAGALAVRPPRTGGLPEVALRTEARADAATLTAYQQLVGEPGTDVLPPGYAHTLAFPAAMAIMTRPDFPLPAVGMVHVANRVEQRRRLGWGEELSVLAWAESPREHKRGVTIDLVTEVSVAGDSGLPAWRGVSTYLASSRPAGLEPGPAAERVDFPEPPAAASAIWRLGPQDTARYAEVSGDRNPIHTSRVAARAFGFPRRIAHGMHTAALALAGMPNTLRGESLTWSVQFGKPVVLPATVGFRPSPDGSFVAWNRRSGKIHLAGTVTPG